MRYPAVQLVIPVYNEGAAVYKNVTAISGALTARGVPHTFIMVDDGSRDGTWEELIRLKRDGAPLLALRLSRNFGKEAAICAGLDAVTENYCVVMDSDLQHPPEIIPQMLDTLLKGGYDLVEGIKTDRGRENILSMVFARVFYGLFRRLTGVDLRNASDFKLISLNVVRAWREMGDASTFFRGMINWVGFKSAKVPFKTAPRSGGGTKFSFIKLITLAVTAITSFSTKPLYITIFFGACFLAAALILGVQTLYKKLSGTAFTGFTTVILLQLIIGSMLLISIGTIGIYISKIYHEVKGRPRYIVAEITEEDK
ncbi:MAG: glycosyltransferase family 2 protein [Clostridiales bacterium]|jgi:dolichol-phosphate mannosyltransferase|nr:glycosyltransferase family 2 protein [Clostridiales bacterium]